MIARGVSSVISVRMPAHLAAWVHAQAERERTNVNQYVTGLLRREPDLWTLNAAFTDAADTLVIVSRDRDLVEIAAEID